MALALVLIATTAGLAAALLILSYRSSVVVTLSDVAYHVRARSIAESALTLAIAEVRRNGTWRTDHAHGVWVSDEPFDGGTFTIAGLDGVDVDGNGTVDGDGDLANGISDRATLVAVGTYQNVTHVVRARVVPEVFSSRVLLFVGDVAALSAQDQAKKAQMEAWGYLVIPMAASASQAEIDAALTEVDVVYISEEIDAVILGTKLTDATIGIVSEDMNLNNELGVSDDGIAFVSSSIEITDDKNHYIAAPFAQGSLPVATVAIGLTYVSGAMAPAGQSLAEKELTNFPTLVAVEAGGTLQTGVAAGRRVVLPWGADSFDFTKLNANGLVITHRALTWAAGRDISVLLVVDDPDNPTVQDAAKQALLESWGHVVTLIDSAAPSFVLAAATHDVAYITEDIEAADLNTKLADKSIGVVNEEANLSDEFGLASGITWIPWQDHIEIDAVSHYITARFDPGTLQISTTLQPVSCLDGVTALDLQVLGRFDIIHRGLSVINAGGALVGGGFAPGRRVDLPWGGTDFDVTTLNDNGRLIIQRAVEWAANITPAGSTILYSFVWVE